MFLRFILGFIVGLGLGYVVMGLVGQQDLSDLMTKLQAGAKSSD